jgi:hypothetical protein
VPAAVVLGLAIHDTPKGTVLGGILHLPVWLWAAVAFSAPIGSMILGGIALAQIKRSGGKLSGTRMAVAALALAFIGPLGGVAAWHFAPSAPQPIFYTFYGVTDFAKGPDGPVLSDAFIKKSHFTPAQVVELNKIVGAYYREFVSIERRHTDVSKDQRGHVHVKIAPFPDESLDLAKRLAAELRGVLGRNVMPQEPKHADELRGIGLFRHCGLAEVSAELWKDGDKYHFEEKHGTRAIPGGTSGGASRGTSGKNWREVFPEEYHVYWTELEN